MFTFAISLRQINDFDYWTHLSIGRELTDSLHGLADVAALLHRLFSNLHSEEPFQLLLYGIYRAGGHDLISIFIAALAAAVFLPFIALVREDISLSRAAVIFLIMITVSMAALFRFVPRPEVLGYFFYTSIFFAVNRWMLKPDTAKLVITALLFGSWMYVHVLWTLGLSFILLYLLFTVPPDFFKDVVLRQKKYVLSALLAVVLFAVYKASLFALFVFSNLLTTTGILSGVTEMRPAWEFPEVLVQYVLTAAVMLVSVLSGEGNRLKKVSFMLVSFGVGLIVVRNTAFALLTMLPLALESLNDSQSCLAVNGNKNRIRFLAAGAGFAAVFLIIRIASVNDPPLGTGVDFSPFPRDAASYVRESALPRPIFNNWDCGGYLLWDWNADPLPFLDGRLGSRQKIQEHDNIVDGIDPDAAIRKYSFQTVLLQPLYQNSGRIVPGVFYFLSNKEWKLVRASDALVFSKQTDSESLDRAAAWMAILEQARKREEKNDPAPHLLYTQGMALFQLGRWDQGREVFLKAGKAHPELRNQYYSQ